MLEKFFKVGDSSFCICCGEKAKEDEEFYNHGREVWTTLYCDCEGFTKFKLLEKEVCSIKLKADAAIATAEAKFRAEVKMLDAAQKREVAYQQEFLALQKKYGK